MDVILSSQGLEARAAGLEEVDTRPDRAPEVLREGAQDRSLREPCSPRESWRSRGAPGTIRGAGKEYTYKPTRRRAPHTVASGMIKAVQTGEVQTGGPSSGASLEASRAISACKSSSS